MQQNLNHQMVEEQDYEECYKFKYKASLPYFENLRVSQGNIDPILNGITKEIQYENGSKYIGTIKDGKREGTGKMTWPDNAQYEGNWHDNCAHGYGKFIYPNGDVYEGDWKNDRCEGKGIYMRTDGSFYEGFWKNDLPHGKGLEELSDGSVFEGNYVNGKKEGYGVYKSSKGSQYEGNWKLNQLSGHGKYTWKDGRVYEGNWENNMMNGKGIYVWPDGKRYEGEYKNNMKEGYGVMTTTKKRYEGYFKNGLQHYVGRSIIGGKPRYGYYDKGKLLRLLNPKNPEDKKLITQFESGLHQLPLPSSSPVGKILIQEEVEEKKLTNEIVHIPIPSSSPVSQSRSDMSGTHSEEAEEMMCKVCYSEKNQIALIPCGHLLCCKCSEAVTLCPFDNQDITKRIKIFYQLKKCCVDQLFLLRGQYLKI